MRGSTRVVSSLPLTTELCLGGTLHAALQRAETRHHLNFSLALPGLGSNARLPTGKQRVLKRYGWGSWPQLGQGHHGHQTKIGHSAKVTCSTPLHSSLAESRDSPRPRPNAVAVGSEQRCSVESAPLSSIVCINDRAHVPSQRVLLIGVGTAGGKMLRHIASALGQSLTSGGDGMEVWAMNTDAQALRATGTQHQLQLGMELMKGLGTGGDSALGMCAAEASGGAIAGVMAGPPGVCYVVCGAGGGTGGGASPLILRAARAAGHLSVGVITLPFRFEGIRRLRQSQATMAALQTEADMVCAIDQDAFLHQQQSLSMTQAADMAASMALHATQGITTLIQAEAAHLSGQAISLHGALPPAGIVEILRGSGRTVVAHGSGASPHSAIHLALQAPQLGSLDMFAGILVCVVSSASPLSATQVADALTRLRGCTGGNSCRVVLATCKEAGLTGTQAVGATIILTGLPHELLNEVGPTKSASPATTHLSQPTSRLEHRQGSFEAVPNVDGAATHVPPSPSLAMAAAALSATSETKAKDGARLPPASGKIVIISAGKDSWDEASSSPGEGDSSRQQPLASIAPLGLEPYSSPLDTPRGGRDSVASQQQEARRRRREGAAAPVSVEQVQSNSRSRDGPQERVPQRRASQTDGAAGVAGGAVRPLPSKSTVEPTRSSSPPGGVATKAHNRGNAQAQKRVAPAKEAADAQTQERRPRTETSVAAAPASVSAPAVGVRTGSPFRADGASQLDRAVAANAAALAWWREVVEEPAERSKAAAEEQQQQEDGDSNMGADVGPGSVSSRARAILARERQDEQYRLVRVKQVLPDGSIYEGQMAGTGPHGHGQCLYPNGDVYEGGWRHGVRHGVGRLSEASGDVYNGAWRGGHRHGQGRVEYSEGHVLSARFVDGHVHGPAIIAFGHGSTFYGAFRFNRRQGVAMTVHPDGKREWEVWEHGQRVS